MSYEGPERRTVITFTREDADRLVRLESQMTSTNEKLDTLIANVQSNINDTTNKLQSNSSRIGKLERKFSWMIGIGTAIVFIITLFSK